MLYSLVQELPENPGGREGAPNPVISTLGQLWVLWYVGDDRLMSCLALAVALRDHALHLPWDLHIMSSLFPGVLSLLHLYPNLVFLITYVILATFGTADTGILVLFVKLASPEYPSVPLWVLVKFVHFCPTSLITTCKSLTYHHAVPIGVLLLALSSPQCRNFSRAIPQFSMSVSLIKPQAWESHCPTHLPATLTGKNNTTFEVLKLRRTCLPSEIFLIYTNLEVGNTVIRPF